MVDNRADVSQQVEWNMAQLLTMELANLRSQANAAFISGIDSYKKAVACLIAMRLSSTHVMDKDEVKKLEKIEKELIEYSAFLSFNFGFHKAPKIFQNVRKVFIQTFMQYNNELQYTLEKYGFLGDRKKDSSKMKI